MSIWMAIEAARRVFAAEFLRSTVRSSPPVRGRDDDGVVTLTGLDCRQVFVAGALTEVQDDGKGRLTGRLSDGTGVFELALFGPHPALTVTVAPLSLPVFVTVSGRAMPPAQQGGNPFIWPDEITPVPRAIRDLWVICTAEETAKRLESARGAVGPLDGEAVRNLAATIGRLLDLVPPPDPAALVEADPVEVLTGILQAGDRKGMPVADLTAAAEQAGLSAQAIERAIQTLLVSGDCYTPVKGTIRLI